MLSSRKRKGESGNTDALDPLNTGAAARKHAYHSSDTSLLFSLPDSVLKYLIEDYLTLQDLAELDSATCNDRDRGVLHSILRSAVLRDQVHLDFPPSDFSLDNIVKLNWILTRQMGLANVSIQYLSCLKEDNEDASQALSLKWSVLKELELTDCSNLVDILLHCSSLERLSLNIVDEDPSLFVEICIQFFNQYATAFGLANTLKSISLSSEYSTGQVVASIVSNCLNLEVIRLGGIDCSDKILSLIFSKYHNLRVASFCYELSFPMLLSGDRLIPCFRPNATLVDLDVFLFDFNDEGLLTIAKCFPNLTHLRIGLRASVTKVGTGAFANGFQNLTSLALYGSARVGDLTLMSLLANRSSLSKLQLRGFRALREVTFGDITQLCPNLHSLTLEDTSIKYDDHLDSSALSRMRRLVLRRESVTDEFLLSFTRACPLLEKLTLSTCQNVTDVGIYHIATHCRNLAHLTLGDLHRVSSEKYIRQVCDNNRKLSRRNVLLHGLGTIRSQLLYGYSPEFVQICRA